MKHFEFGKNVVSGISKKLEAEAKKEGGKDIRPWIKSVVNHIYWIWSSCGNDGELKTLKWMSIVNHISNKHEGHSPAFPKCDHGDIQQERQWIKEGNSETMIMYFLIIYRNRKKVKLFLFFIKHIPAINSQNTCSDSYNLIVIL